MDLAALLNRQDVRVAGWRVKNRLNYKTGHADATLIHK